MKVLKRKFTLKETILIIVLAVIILGLAYYKFVDEPVRSQTESAETQAESLETEKTIVTAQLTNLRKMENELSEAEAGGEATYMASYNNSAEEIAFLNTIFYKPRVSNYSFGFSDVTKDGNQIRRNVSISYSTSSYDEAMAIIEDLSESHLRLVIGNVSASVGNSRDESVYSVSLTITFFETMVGGIADAGLPAE